MINRKIREISRASGLDENKIIKVAFALYVAQDYPTLLQEYLQGGEVTSEDVEHIYRIELFEFDGQYSLKFPLFEEEVKNSRFDEFWKMLVGRGNKYGMTVNGHISNRQTFAAISKSQETIDAFNRLSDSVELERACMVISRYYRETQWVKKLENYLNEVFETDYESFEEEAQFSKII